MPELPEVEITRRHLSSAMTGRRLSHVRVDHARTARHNASPAEITALLEGRTVESVGRHGKFLILGLDDDHTLVAHLGMSGRFSVVDSGAPLEKHTHFAARLDDESEVRFIDPRTFGYVAVYDMEELGSSGVRRLGPDAWLSPPPVGELSRVLEGRTAPIKALLLDQKPLSGLGNIYADETLFRSRIHPLRPGGDISPVELEALLAAVRETLEKAIANGGTTLDDLAYLLPDGRAGENMMSLAVYGRSGDPCPDCGSTIEKVIVRGRSTHFCPECQR